MPRLGYVLSCEEHGPNELVRHARRAEEVGFDYVLISDHYHPWISRQGNSAFVWCVIGAIARETERIRVGTGVTCPTVRIHPAVIAQAAATAAVMLPGRFFLGVGSGENLNEHIVGAPWPSVERRHRMLEEAVDVMRLLWRGGQHSHYGEHYTLDNARLFTLPDEPPLIYLAAHGEKAATLAGRIADGFIGVVATDEMTRCFDAAGGAGKPKIGMVKVCYAADESEGRRIAREWWPTIALRGQLSQDLALPSHFEAATQLLTEDDVAARVPCGPDTARHLRLIESYASVGYDHVTVHQIGPDQESFFRFYADEILPRVQPHARHEEVVQSR
ncbi:MAG: TIGR03557 family F420-dependent LLM class oxidoreductase [Actinomycetota bacterium]|nr:TIGR03557 family F420-dependent LLM class oxidoreductase [Actinomycetota bacterium]